MMKHATATTAGGMVAAQGAVDAGKKRPSMDLGDQDRVKRTKDVGDKAAAMAAAAVPQFPGAAAMAMPLVPPGPWPYPSSFPLMPPMGMPFCFPPAFFPAPFMFPPFWFANAMNACSAAAGMPGSATSTAPGVHAAAMAPAGSGAMNMASAMQMPPNAGMAPFAPLPMMAAAHAAAAANMQMQPMATAPCAAPALAPVPAATPLPTALLQQLASSSPDGGCAAAAGQGTCGPAPTSGSGGMPAPLFVDCCGPSLSDGGNSGAVTPSVSDGSIAAPATPEVNDISDQEFVSFIDSFLNLPDDGLACSIPLMVCGEDDASPVGTGCHLMDDDTDLTCTLGLGLKLSKSDSLLNLLDRELACAANASAAAGFAI